MIKPEWLFEKPIEIIIGKIFSPKLLKQIAIESYKLDGKQLNKELAEKMINPYFY